MVGIAGGCESITPIETEGDPVIRLRENQIDFSEIASAQGLITGNQNDNCTVIVT